MLNAKNAVRWYQVRRISFILTVLSTLTLIIGWLAQSSITTWIGGYELSASFVLVGLTFNFASATDMKILETWELLGCKPRDFPQTAEEREALIPWAKQFLASRARDANRAFASRDRYRDIISRKMQDVRVNNPPDLKQMRKVIHDAERLRENSDWGANHHQKEFLRAWDFFTKSEDNDGIYLLHGTEFSNPNVFRRQIADLDAIEMKNLEADGL